jgi:uncharacterized membrane protein YhaH (DUF805 family)
MNFKWLLSNYDGRIDLAKYWEVIIRTLVSCLIFLLIFKAGLKLVQVGFLAVFKNPLPFDPSFSDLLSVYAGWNLESLATVTIKRLHDRNKSGWWIVPFFMAPVLLHRPSDWLADPPFALLVDALGYGLGGWCFIDLLGLRGTTGPNRFGPDPLAPRKTQWVQPSEIEPVPQNSGPPPAWLVKRGDESAAADQCSGQ